MRTASEIEVGSSCRIGGICGTPAVRIDPGDLESSIASDYILFLTNDHKIVGARHDAEVGMTFGYEGPPSAEDDRAAVKHVSDVIGGVESLWQLNSVHNVWEERMKELAAEILKPGSDEEINEEDGGLDALDYIWHLQGAKSYTVGDGPWMHRALDYYLGRTVTHVWGTGKLMKIAYDYAECEHDKEWFGHGRVWLSDKDDEHNLPARGIEYGIALKFPCQCGKVEYDMFAIPGVHTGGFAYLVDETTSEYLDVRNQIRVCESCAR